MQAASDKTFHLKWNNHLQNLSQLFTAIYSSSALADVTLACRDGTLRAHKLVLSACSPYFEQIFKDNPCKHPVVILKGIPFQEINLLVEFMYKGSVDVQELDLQSLMHTASELEIRGLAYEVRANAAQLLNVNLEYPAYSTPAVTVASTSPYETSPRSLPRTDMERLKQIHMYQQSMLREAELAKRKRREEPMPTNTTAAVKSILAAAAKELADGTRERTTSCVQTEDGEATVKTEMFHAEEETWSRPKKRVSIFTPEEEKARRRKMQYVVKQSPQHDGQDDGLSKLRISAVMGADAKPLEAPTSSSGGGIKVVNLSALQQPGQAADQPSDDEESSLLQERGHQNVSLGDDDDSCSSGSASESAHDTVRDSRPHVCDICDIRFQRASHLNRHRLTHTGERPFTCGGCGKSFARSDKLRVHTKICERDDPTVDMADEGKPEATGEVMSGTVRITHRDSRQLMFTPSGDVMLAPRALTSATPQPASAQPPDPAAVKNELIKTDGETPTKRGRGRPKKPVPDVPKIKKRRGRPPKALSGTPPPVTLQEPTSHSIELALHQATPRRKSLLDAMKAIAKYEMKTSTKTIVYREKALLKRKRASIVKREREKVVGKSKKPSGWKRARRNAIDLDLMMGLGNGGLNVGAGVSGFSYEAVAAAAAAAAAAGAGAGAGAGGGTVPMQQHITPSGQQLIVKRKRGRPPKNFFQPLADGRPKENYNATNLPFGDFSYLTEMINYQGGPAYPHPFHSVTTVDPEQDVDMDTAPGSAPPASSHDQSDPHGRDDSHHGESPRRRTDRTIDLSSSSSDDGTEDSRADHMLEGDENVPAAICETEIMTVGDCQILKLPPGGDDPPRPNQDAAGAPSENGKLSITAITSIGDCTIRPVDADAASAPAHQ